MNSRQLKVFLISMAALLFYTGIDIASQPLWADNMTNYPHYYLVWQIALAGYLIIIAYVFKNVFVPFAVLLATMNGTEDFLYYVLQGQLPPATLPWLNNAWLVFPKPATNISVFIGATWGLTIILIAASRTKITTGTLTASV